MGKQEEVGLQRGDQVRRQQGGGNREETVELAQQHSTDRRSFKETPKSVF